MNWIKPKPWKRILLTALIEIIFILFLFYANLLMGEYTRSGKGSRIGLLGSVKDILTWENFLIGLVAAILGYGIFEYLRSLFKSNEK